MNRFMFLFVLILFIMLVTITADALQLAHSGRFITDNPVPNNLNGTGIIRFFTIYLRLWTFNLVGVPVYINLVFVAINMTVVVMTVAIIRGS